MDEYLTGDLWVLDSAGDNEEPEPEPVAEPATKPDAEPATEPEPDADADAEPATKPEPDAEAEPASENSAIDATGTTFSEFASPFLDLDFPNWMMDESVTDPLWDLVLAGQKEEVGDNENDIPFQEVKKLESKETKNLDSELGVQCGSTKKLETIPSSESNGYPTLNHVSDLVQVKDYFSACRSTFQDFQHGRKNINPFNIIKRIINGPLGASLEACLSYWFEQVMYHWFKVRGFPFSIFQIKALNVDIYWIKAAIESGGGGRKGIIFCLEHVHEILRQRRCDPSMVHANYSDDGLDRTVNIDGLVGRTGISGASDKILEIMEYMLARIPAPHSGARSIIRHGSKFDNNPKGKGKSIHPHQSASQVYSSSSSVMYGIHPHQSQYLVDYSSSVMFNGGHPHQSQYLVGYSSSAMFNGAHPRMLTDGKGILPHQSQTQVDSSSSFMLRDGNGKVNFNVHKWPLSESSSVFPETYVNQSQGIDNISTMATRNSASNQFDESPSLATKVARTNGINAVKRKQSLTWSPLRPIKIPRRSQNREIIPHSINENKCDNSSRSYTFILEKELSNSDVSSAGRIVLPKKKAEAHLPRLDIKDGITIAIEDKTLPRIWHLRYRFWPNNKTRMYILEYTEEFVKTHGLKVGDYMVLYKDEEGKLVIEGKKQSFQRISIF